MILRRLKSIRLENSWALIYCGKFVFGNGVGDIGVNEWSWGIGFVCSFWVDGRPFCGWEAKNENDEDDASCCDVGFEVAWWLFELVEWFKKLPRLCFFPPYWFDRNSWFSRWWWFMGWHWEGGRLCHDNGRRKEGFKWRRWFARVEKHAYLVKSVQNMFKQIRNRGII